MKIRGDLLLHIRKKMSTFLVDIKGNVSLLLITDHQILLENFLAE